MPSLPYVGIQPRLWDGSIYPEHKASFICVFCGTIYQEQGAKCECSDTQDMYKAFNREAFRKERQRFFVVPVSRRRFIVSLNREDLSADKEALRNAYREAVDIDNVFRAERARAIAAKDAEERNRRELEARAKAKNALIELGVDATVALAVDALDSSLQEGDWTVRQGIKASDVVSFLRENGWPIQEGR